MALTQVPLDSGVVNTLPVANGGTGVTTSTGSGSVVLSTSPTLVTPALGTPSSVVLTNATSVPVNQATGTLAVANGGTGLTSTPTNGQIDIGNGTGFTRAAITAGTGISVTNGSGSISIANSGVTSLASGRGVSVSGSTGSVTASLAAGTVLQVQSTTITSTFSSTSTTPTDITGFSVTITPQSSSNKILVFFSTTGSTGNSLNLYLNRNGTIIDVGSGGSSKNATIASIPAGNVAWEIPYAAQYLDSPATTSAVTYKIQADTDANTFYIGRRGQASDFNSPSTITAMEIAG